MKKFIVAGLVVAGLGILAPAFAEDTNVSDPTPTGAFTDEDGNQGYVSAGPDNGVRACNENDKTPAGDNATGYIWVNPNGDEPTDATYGPSTVGVDGDGYVGAGDSDGADNPNSPNPTDHDCP